MGTELRALSVDDGQDVFAMLREMPAQENGFYNTFCGLDYEAFRAALPRYAAMARGVGLEDWMVPQETHWLYADGVPIGFGKLRTALTLKLLVDGGHVGYAIRPGYRGMGYGKLLLRLLCRRAASLGMDRLLLTIHNDNAPSLGAALACGATVEKVSDTLHYIWLTTAIGGNALQV